jgi:superfamily II DNA or RNA helicase
MAQSDHGIEDTRIKHLLLRRARISADSARRTAAAVAVSQRFSGRQLLFHERITPATRIAELLDRAGDRVGLYHSGLGPSLRRRNLELFKSGQFAKLVTCRALDEGLNVPDARAAVIAASTRSTRQRVQRLGRVLRTAPDKEAADVATLYATQIESDTLRREAASIGEIAEVHWYEVSI